VKINLGEQGWYALFKTWERNALFALWSNPKGMTVNQILEAIDHNVSRTQLKNFLVEMVSIQVLAATQKEAFGPIVYEAKKTANQFLKTIDERVNVILTQASEEVNV
jgi:hypothetical protein